MTVRDEIWDVVLEHLQKNGRLKISDLPFEDSQRHTVRRVLKGMERQGWLHRTSERGHTWYAGDRAKEILDMESRAEVLSDPEFEL
jgi:DNA-binding IclR family transcriptional regulator